MENKDNIPKIEGWLDWVLYDENGIEKQRGSDHNQVQHQTNDLSATNISTDFTHMKLNTAAKPNDVATAFAAGYLAGPWTVITSSTPVINVVTVIATIPAGIDTGVILTAGLFSTPTATGLRCCADCSCTKDAGDSIVLNWTVTYTYS